MKSLLNTSMSLYGILGIISLISCKQKNPFPSTELINQINLKKGEVISCGVADKQFGSADFEMTCDKKSKSDFNLAIELLHSFEYDS